MTPEEAFAIYLNYAPELEFLNGGDSEDKAFTESMLAIVPDAADREIFLNEADNLYRLAAQGFFDQIVKPFEKNLKDLANDKYDVSTKRRIKIIEGNQLWKFRSKDNNLLFEAGFLFIATQGKCTATPWFWSSGKAIKLNRDQLAKKLKTEFSFPRTGNWYPGTLIAKSVEYCPTSNIEELNSNLISPIEFAVKAIVRHIEL
ncbi:MAG: hypothetical protein ACYCUY_03750 [Acidithiobacillus sp.]